MKPVHLQPLMKSRAITYYLLKHKLSCLVMIVTLLWLTVSTPFVYNYQQQVKKEAVQKQQSTDKSDDTSNPLSTTNEEKSESGINTLSEYLHDVHILEHYYTLLSNCFECRNSNLYLAFHPETISPPPDSAS